GSGPLLRFARGRLRHGPGTERERRRRAGGLRRSQGESLMNNQPTPVMDALVDFVLGVETSSLPPAAVEATGRSLTDWLGTAIRGAAERLSTSLAAVIAASGGLPQATVVGRGLRSSALNASLANGAQSHALDFDDTHLPSIVHGAAPVAPVVLALSEWRRLSGAQA